MLPARTPVIDAVPVADVSPAGGAEQPDRVLDEAREGSRKARVELASVSLPGEVFDHLGAAARPITGISIRVLGSEPAQYAGPVQVIVDEAVDCHKARARGHPPFPIRVADEQELGEDHRPELPAGIGDVDERTEQRLSHLDGAGRMIETRIGGL